MSLNITLTEEGLKVAIDKLNDYSERINSKISPFLYKGISEKKSIELCQAGRFLTILGESSIIIKHEDSPDFIFSYQGRDIGLEHERIFRPTKSNPLKSINKLFIDSGKHFKSKYPCINIIAACYLTSSDFIFKKSDSLKLMEEISEYIYQLVTNQPTKNKPAFIEEVHLLPHSDVHFYYNPGGYITSNIDTETLTKAIQKKQQLIGKYKTNSQLEEQWLLLVLSSSSPDSYHFSEKSIDLKIKSPFDRVYIMEDFDAKIWQLL